MKSFISEPYISVSLIKTGQERKNERYFSEGIIRVLFPLRWKIDDI